MQKIVTNLWFDDQAETAARYYTSLFEDGKILAIEHYGEASSNAANRPLGSVMLVTFQLAGQEFLAINGGPVFKLSPAVSLQVRCETQEEIDRLWDALTEGGEGVQCGWLTDRFGLSWQITPTALEKMATDPDPVKKERVMAAMLTMVKLDIAGLTKAYRGE